MRNKILAAFGAAILAIAAIVGTIAGRAGAVDGNNFQISHPIAAIYVASPTTLADLDQDTIHTDAYHRVFISPPVSNTWSVYNISAAAATATATQAAGASGVKHVCTSIHASVTGDSTGGAASGTLVVRDGATLAGTVKWSTALGLAAGANEQGGVVNIPVHIVGSPATAMTIEFTSAASTHLIESVAMTGFDTK